MLAAWQFKISNQLSTGKKLSNLTVCTKVKHQSIVQNPVKVGEKQAKKVQSNVKF
jgi:hypothetical protein